MRYQGGKSRIANDIVQMILPCVAGGGTFVSLFCGSCAVETSLCSKANLDKIVLNDKHPYLISMLKALQKGWIPPDTLSVKEYKYIRLHKEENPPLTGFAGFGCTFGGKWFGGYAKNSKNHNYCLQSKNTLLRDMTLLQEAYFICTDYRNIYLPENCVVYADPPYNNTTQYNNEKFNSGEFWNYMREISKDHIVFVSEQEAPSDFVMIWEKPLRRTLDKNKDNNFVVTERLFVYKGCRKYFNRR